MLDMGVKQEHHSAFSRWGLQMRHGSNYRRYLEGELEKSRFLTEKAQVFSAQTEQNFLRALPPDEDVLSVTDESLRNPIVICAREAFRDAHAVHYLARSHQAEIEDEYFEYPEDWH